MTSPKTIRAALAASILAMGTGVAAAVTLHVQNNGVDSATCGGVAAPCRSISRAIANASAKDRILVGPGLYGDLNGNQVFGEAGEEPGSIVVNKPLTLESEEGAGATIIDMSGLLIDVVTVTSGGVGSVIGLPGRGFTLSNGGWGLSSANPFPGLLTVSGNIAVNNLEDGFLLHEPGPYVVDYNLAIRNATYGFIVHGGTGHKFRQNVAVSNRFAGFAADFGTGHEFSGNLAIGNGSGGFSLDHDTGLTVRGNSAFGNTSFGVGFFFTTATAAQNNVYGNDPAGNCGVRSENSTVNAANNFFGAASGPGSDPADNVCSGSGSIVFIPFAPFAFTVSTTWR